jgi:hypothetical protein
MLGTAAAPEMDFRMRALELACQPPATGSAGFVTCVSDEEEIQRLLQITGRD